MIIGEIADSTDDDRDLVDLVGDDRVNVRENSRFESKSKGSSIILYI